MPILAYIAVILVSLGGILFELNWLTSPKLDAKPAVQASTTSAPPKVAVATVAASTDETPAANKETSSGLRNVAPNVTMVPGAVVAPKPEAAPAPPQQTVSAPETNPQPTASVAAINPAPVGAASASTNAAALSPTETTGSGSTDFKREFTTDTKADSRTSSATFTPSLTTPAAAATVTPATVTPATVTPAVAMSSSNKCDIAACSAAYQSFRASDCSYQPMDGNTRKLCDRTPGSAQQANTQTVAPARRIETAVRTDAVRKPSKESGLRAFEREVRRVTASEAALEPDRGYDRGGRSQVIVIGRRDW